MEHRVTALETWLDSVLPTLATKGDIRDAKASIVMWAATIVASATAIIIAVTIFGSSRITIPQVAPAVINNPAPAAAPTPTTAAAPAR
jgi:hypothetical protein